MIQIQKLEEENSGLRERLKAVEGQTTGILEARQGLQQQVRQQTNQQLLIGFD